MIDDKIILLPGDCMEVLAMLPENSIDSCVTDPPYLLTSIVKRFGGDNSAPAQHGADGRFKRLSGGFMNRRWDAPDAALGLSVFEAWLAGFIAGEGCFRVQSHKDAKYYTCQFSIHLRKDDAAILIACQKRIGGRIVFHDARENKQGIKSKPDVRWVVETREGCLTLANILDRVPLFAKKANDYALWRRALDLWINTPKGSRWCGPRDVSEMAALHKRLQEVKRWDGISEVDLNFDPFMPPAQAFHYRWAREVYRVLKPGAHLISFGGTRTHHRMACAIEDAGFEIRDTILYLYGSGFPKSHDVSKGIDRAAGVQRALTKAGTVERNRYGDDWDTGPSYTRPRFDSPATDAARQWQGWGTALKPACEPIVLARKPLSEKTVAANVLRWGTGAINVDACRIESNDSQLAEKYASVQNAGSRENNIYGKDGRDRAGAAPHVNGRWPANVITDGSEEVVGAFPDTGKSPPIGSMGGGSNRHSIYGDFAGERNENGFGDEGSAARFFYSSKADSDDRIGSKHPTVKPVDLMQYLIRLVTHKGGMVLDPFAGTGTTGEAAFREGMRATLIEREPEYQADIRRRIALCMAGPDERKRESIKAKTADKPVDAGPLFGGTNGGAM